MQQVLAAPRRNFRCVEPIDCNLQQARSVEPIRMRQHKSALDKRGFHAGQIYGGALPGASLRHLPSMDLQAANASEPFRRKDLNRVSVLQSAAPEGAGHNGSETLQGKTAIDGQTRQPTFVARRNALDHTRESALQFLDSAAVDSTKFNDLGVLQKRAGAQSSRLPACRVHLLGAHQIRFAEHDNSVLDTE